MISRLFVLSRRERGFDSRGITNQIKGFSAIGCRPKAFDSHI
jgi:hypothetical protein